MAQWTDYGAAADMARKWAAALDRKGRPDDAELMRLLGEAAAEKAAALAVKAVAEAPAQRGTGDGPACSLCGQAGLLDKGGLTATCYNTDCVRHRVPVAVAMF